uniref:Phosphatidylinositol N-acetylglucosaminyltransferase subunit Y n=1 Tax=Araucaria cunninghamii TaxID=56994 RepID=A0A0D6R4K3_ARACU
MFDKMESKVKAKASMNKSETLQLYSSTTCSHHPGSHSFYWGLTLIISGVASFIVFLYAAILSKMLPPSGIPLLSAIESDRYYSLLVPLTLPILVVLVYFHWLSMKLFKHA